MKKVLIVDDTDLIRFALGRLMNKFLGVSVIESKTVSEALEILSTEPVDLVLTDMHMPGRTGQELVISLKNKYPEIPVVVLTIDQDPELKDSLLKAGALQVLYKEGDTLTLVTQLKEIFDFS